jgi:NAD(P)-dependent dehydrogenase (short-subunit alcohol dehydrogenase family)
VARALDRFGRVDILVNNAGIITVGPMETMTLDDYRDVIATNFWGELYPTLAVLPHMRAREFGRIANVVSLGGKFAMPHLLPYTISKYALTGLTEGLRTELVRDNIFVTGIYPSTIRTGGHTHAWFKGDHQAEYTWFALGDTVPLLSTSADYAARRLWDAVCHGDPQVIVGWQARVAIALHNTFPDLTAEMMAVVNRLQPTPVSLDAPAVRGEQLQGTMPGLLNRLVPPAARPGSA